MLLILRASRYTHFVVICFGLTAYTGISSIARAETALQPFGIDDYFKIRRVVELALSSDGEMIAYAVVSNSLEENKSVRAVYISSTVLGAEPLRTAEIQNAHSLAWIPGTHELAFLSSDKGTSHLYSINKDDNELRQHTFGEYPIVKFRFAPDGQTVAWLTQTDSRDSSSQTVPGYNRSKLYERLFNGEAGIVFDSENTIFYQFVNPDWPNFSARPHTLLWLKRAGAEAFAVNVPGQVQNFYWSGDSTKLSVSYSADDIPRKAFSDRLTSIGFFDFTTMAFRPLIEARPASNVEAAQYYTGGEWVPGEDKLFIRRTTERDRWVSKVEWSLTDLAKDAMVEHDSYDWREVESYSRDSGFLPVDESTVFSNKTVHARQSLYRITPSGIKRAGMLSDIEGSTYLLRFSADFEKAAFVNESLTRPPEVYVWQAGRGWGELTNLNKTIANRILPSAREVSWKSYDGVVVHGWLLEPTGGEADEKPWPLIAFVHGGPGIAVLDEFAFYFKEQGGLWPYPLEVYAINGMAAFIPNYRGTKTFGHEFADPTSLDGEPIDDIVSGIEHLVDEGIADPNRLAISGHSHGAWLGPLVMTRARRFRAGSFAELSQNQIVNYSLMAGWLNREVHDVHWSASLYDDPHRYIEVSPDFHFKGLNTAVLFEAGAKSFAIAMMGSPKAANQAGMPTEFVVYPQTGHNIQIPRLQKESAERNLDWFRFWLKGEGDPDPT